MNDQRKAPGLLSRSAAWTASVLLTVLITVTLFAGAGVHAATSEDMHVRISTDPSIVSGQMERIADVIRELAEDYPFSASDAVSAVSTEELEALNRETAQWWTLIVTDGIMGDIPAWSSEKVRAAVEKSIDRDKLPADTDPSQVSAEVAQAIEKTVQKSILPVRKALISMAVRYLNRRIDLPGAIHTASQVPWAGAACCFLLTGLIALLTGKEIRRILKYYGASFAGAGIASLFGLVMTAIADIPSMIRESSAGLAEQAGKALGNVMLVYGMGAFILLATGICCLAVYRRNPGPEQ